MRRQTEVIKSERTREEKRLLSSGRAVAVPHRFVLDALESLHPTTRAMFGALAVYVGDKIVALLRERQDDPGANGVWLASASKDSQALKAVFPNARPVHIMGKDIRGWILLCSASESFEENATHACELIAKGDTRFGRVPKSRS